MSHRDIFKKEQDDSKDSLRLSTLRGHSGCCEGNGLWVKGDVGRRGSREGGEEAGVQVRNEGGLDKVWAVGLVRGSEMENEF